MKLFLDENISPTAKVIFEQSGYDVVSVHSLGLKGKDDPYLFEEARKQKRIFITQNGKHFIILVPPVVHGVEHRGIIWIRFNVTRINAQQVCDQIHQLLQTHTSIVGSIWKLKDSSGIFMFQKRYPAPKEELVF